MSKVNAAMGDVKLVDFSPAPPERYRLVVEKIEETFKDAEGNPNLKRQNYNFTFAIDDGGEHNGKKIFHNVAIHKKDGSTNAAGVSDMRRLFGAVMGADPADNSFPWDEQDSDQLLNQNFMADVTIESYPKNTTPPTFGMRNVINSQTIGPV